MLVRLGVLVSGLAVVVVLVWTISFLVLAGEWWPFILMYAGFLIGVALAVIWLAALVLHVIIKGVGLMHDEPGS
jgi:hypothetical protein